ncbi:MAG: hypothetical protein ACXACI_05000 [Candidatus Hodarchaeales archaeon]
MSKGVSPVPFAEYPLDSFQEIEKEIQHPVNQLASTGTRYAEAARNFLRGMNGIKLALVQMTRELEKIWEGERIVQENLFGFNTMVHQWQQEHENFCFAIQELENMKEEIPQ